MRRVLPILFNTEMVRAILDGRKSCTRRIVKHDVEAILNSPYHKEHPEVEDEQIISKLCIPPYQPGDILYVRETWCEYGDLNDSDQIIDGTEKYYYRADGENPTPYNYFLVHRNGNDEHRDFPVWHPSIHMPKEAARIWLKVTDVRVERLQEITDEQAEREGIQYDECPTGFTWKQETDMHNCYTTPIGAMQALWDSTIKKSDIDRYGWDASPWVWVIEFERCEKPQEV